MKLLTIFTVWVVLVSCSELPTPGQSEAEADVEADTENSALDLREANVIDVTYDADTGQFGVTLQHDDDGEDGYADWWQVETLEGEQLGRRVLTHRHDNNPFTRYQTIDDLQGEEYVVIRGHDMDHGYGGQAIIFNTGNGEMEMIDQGGDPQEFSAFSPGF